MALERAVRTYEPTLPGIAAFLQTKDLLSLLTVLERKALEGDEEGGRREESFHPLPSSRLIERLTSQCVELKLKATPKYHLGSVTVQGIGHDGLTRRQLNGIHAAIQAIPLWFPSDAKELSTEPCLVVTNRSATDGAVDFFVPSVPCQVTVSPASPCSGKVCQMTSLLLCSCCKEELRGCGQCAIECPADCPNELICPGCSVFSLPDAEEYIPGELLGCIQCCFLCVHCGYVLDCYQKAQCDGVNCPHAFPGDTCQNCAGVRELFILQCRFCKSYKCEDCESMIDCGCYRRECRSCAEEKGGSVLCCGCGSEICTSCTSGRIPCGVCGKRLCQDCDENYKKRFEKCERCRKRCCKKCLTRCGFGGCEGQNSSLCKNCTQDKETCNACGKRACETCQEYEYCDWYCRSNKIKMHCENDSFASLYKMSHCSRCDKFFCPARCITYCEVCEAGMCEACHATGCDVPSYEDCDWGYA